MKVTIFGSGYVGLVQGTVLAETGHDVICVDTDSAKVERLNGGISPIYEPGLSELIKKNLSEGRLSFTTDAGQGVRHGEVIFIAVGTPPREDGSADLCYVEAVAGEIARHMEEYKVIVNKSTVPVGTAARVRSLIGGALAARGSKTSFDVVSNPEFLKQGAAVADCTNCDRIIIGTESAGAAAKMRGLYAPLLKGGTQLLEMDTASAELAKYAANSMLAMKISFINEIANLAELLGADIDMVRSGIGSDSRIGFHFINPGCGYGGSCFPKDVKALVHAAGEKGYNSQLLRAVDELNNSQKEKLFSQISAHFQDKLAGLTIALWGLAFKPETNDMREAPSRVLTEALWKAGVKVRAYDPKAMDEARAIFGGHPLLELTPTKEEALRGADALVICTEWKEFRDTPPPEIKPLLKNPLVFDGRNLYDVEKMLGLGFTYYSIGRGRAAKKA